MADRLPLWSHDCPKALPRSHTAAPAFPGSALWSPFTRDWRNTVGNLIESLWLKTAYLGPQSTGICAKQQRGTVSSNSSNSRFQAVLFKQ